EGQAGRLVHALEQGARFPQSNRQAGIAAARSARGPPELRENLVYFQPIALLQPLGPIPTWGTRRPLGAAQANRSGPLGRTIRISLNYEVMPCELSILLPSIVRPSVSTGSSPCSTASRPLRAIRPTISSVPARTPIASRWRWPALARTSFRSKRRKTR